MSDARYEQALSRHFRRSLNRGWCRAPYCTTCGALDYRRSLRDELRRAWAEEHGLGDALPEPPFPYPMPVTGPALAALAALGERGALVGLGVDRDDLAMLEEQLIDNHPLPTELHAERHALQRAASHACMRRPDRANAQAAWCALPAAQRLRDLLDDSHPKVDPPWLTVDELGPVMELGLEDLGRLRARAEGLRSLRGTRSLREVIDYARSLNDPGHRLHAAWMAPDGVPQELAQAYSATLFVVRDDGHELVLRIGVRSEAAAELHRRFGVTESCIITAWNPQSRQLPDAENAARHRRLEAGTVWLELPTLPAEGRDPKGEWTPEQSLWIAGAGLKEEHFLGRTFDQHAIVCIGPDAVPRLAWPAQVRGLGFVERTRRGAE